MGQQHGDRLTPLDASFLHVESTSRHMHVGCLIEFDSSDRDGLTFDRFAGQIRSRLHLVPRFRHKLAYPSGGVANPIWVDDEDFDLTYHLRHSALPRPGTKDELLAFAGRLFSRQLDRRRPMWEMYFIEGLDDGGVAIFAKTHHAMVDGVSGMDIATLLFDLSDEVSDVVDAPAWKPQARPTDQQLTADGVDVLFRGPMQSMTSVLRRSVTAPTQALQDVANVGQEVASFLRSGFAGRAPRTILNREPGVNRRLGTHQITLSELRQIKSTFGMTVNDVVLSIVGQALGAYLRSRGQDTHGLHLRAAVPVNVRTAGEASDLGNRVSNVFVDLPVDEMDPVERLRACAQQMAIAKTSGSADGGDFLLQASHLAPPVIQGIGARLAFNSRMYNLIVTNVPGPQIPVYCLGARSRGAYPMVPLAAGQGLAVGMISLDGVVNVGLTADYDAVPDVDVFGALMEEALSELLRSADAERERSHRLDTPGQTA